MNISKRSEDSVGKSGVFKSLIQSSIFYTFANAIEAAAPILLAIVLTRLLEPNEYGVWILFIALVTFIRPIINLSVQDALRMHFYEMNIEERARFVWGSLCLSLVCLCVIATALWVTASFASSHLNFPKDWLVTVPFAAFLYASFYFLLAYFQFSQNRMRFLLLHVVQTSASLAIIAAFVWHNNGWQAVVIGKITGLALAVFIGAYWLSKGLRFSKDVLKKPRMAKLMKFGFLYLPTGMGLVAIPLTDRIIVTEVLGLAENGLFGAAALFGSAVYVVINGFIHAWMPWLFRSLADPGVKTGSITRVSIFFYLGLPLVGLLLYIITIFIAPLLIGSAYTEAFELIPWAIAGTVAMGYFFHNQAFLHFRRAVVAMSTCSFYCIVSNAMLSYYGAIYYGTVGVFYATVLAFASAAILCGLFIFLTYRQSASALES